MMPVKPARPRCTIAAACLLALLGACEGAHWRAAQRSGSVAAYRGFLARHPRGAHAGEAAQGLERASFRAAQRADRPLGYRQYLERYPRGAFAAAARERLAHLALARAASPAELALVVERYEGTRAGRVATDRLIARAAAQALRQGTPEALQAFLARHPRQPPWSVRVRERLASVSFARLGDDPLELLAFVDQHAASPYAVAAERRLAEVLVRAIHERAEAVDLALFTARFSADPRLPELERLVAARQRQERLAAFRPQRLRRLAGEAAEAGDPLPRWCVDHPVPCHELAAQAAAAGPWRAPVGRRTWERARTGTDPLELWSAAEALAWSGEAVAGERLASLTSSPRLVEIWPATEALGSWLARLSPAARVRWLGARITLLGNVARPEGGAAATGTAGDGDDPALLQRSALLALLAGQPAEQARARGRLRRLAADGPHALAASFLFVLHAAAPGQVGDSDELAFVRSAAARVDQLEQIFPAKLVQEAEVAATLAERELFVLSLGLARATGATVPVAIRRVSDGAQWDALTALRRRVVTLLARWQKLLAQAYPDFRPARRPSSSARVAEHEAGRPAALARLQRSREPVARAIAQAICAELTRLTKEASSAMAPGDTPPPGTRPTSPSAALLLARCAR